MVYAPSRRRMRRGKASKRKSRRQWSTRRRYRSTRVGSSKKRKRKRKIRQQTRRRKQHGAAAAADPYAYAVKAFESATPGEVDYDSEHTDRSYGPGKVLRVVHLGPGLELRWIPLDIITKAGEIVSEKKAEIAAAGGGGLQRQDGPPDDQRIIEAIKELVKDCINDQLELLRLFREFAAGAQSIQRLADMFAGLDADLQREILKSYPPVIKELYSKLESQGLPPLNLARFKVSEEMETKLSAGNPFDEDTVRKQALKSSANAMGKTVEDMREEEDKWAAGFNVEIAARDAEEAAKEADSS